MLLHHWSGRNPWHDRNPVKKVELLRTSELQAKDMLFTNKSLTKNNTVYLTAEFTLEKSLNF